MSRIIPALILTFCIPASATCIGTSSFSTCSDTSGNRYNVQRFGNTTSMQGYNSNTGSSWSQRSTQIGNTTFNSGFSADGGAWNTTRQDFGNGNYTISGSDSQGNSVYKSCFYGLCD